MFEPPVIEITTEVCSVDWRCLWEHIGNPMIWGPLIYGALITIVALTPTERDDKALARINNVLLKYKDTLLRVFLRK